MTKDATPACEQGAGVYTVADGGSRTMKRLTNQILKSMEPPEDDGDLIPAIGRALSLVRGRPVRLRPSAFPPETASGLWIHAPTYDLIVYEENTDPMHQQVIIGHEAWHMFSGHCGSPAAHGVAATRASEGGAAALLESLVREIADLEAAEAPLTERMDAALHIAALRAESAVHVEELAEVFGFLFRTALHGRLEDARVTADLHGIAGRIQVSMSYLGHRA